MLLLSLLLLLGKGDSHLFQSRPPVAPFQTSQDAAGSGGPSDGAEPVEKVTVTFSEKVTVTFSESSVVRVWPRDLREWRLALTVSEDIWSHQVRNGEIDLHVSSSARQTLERAGVPLEVLIADVPGLIETQAKERAARRGAAEGGIAGEDWFADVKDLPAINAKLDEWIANHPGLVTPIVVGTSLESRPIRGVRISLAPTGEPVPAFLFNACQHAREWATPMVAMLLAEQLIEGAAGDPLITSMLQGAEVFIVPVVNPDGYKYSWDEVRLWRKNRRNNGNGTFGVDLNRNWGFQWGGEGASANPNSDTYRGPAPFSEPETQALRDFVLGNGRIIGHIDFHSYSQFIMWPWSWTSQLCIDEPLFASLGAAMQDAVEMAHGLQYTTGPIYTTIYPASGSSVDWAYGAAGAKSTTIEVRDEGNYGFLIPPEEVRPCAEENASAALAMMKTLLVPGFLSIDGGMPDNALPGDATPITVFATPLTGTFAASPRLFARIGTSGAFTMIESVPIGDDRYATELPAAPCAAVIDWYIEWQGARSSVTLPDAAPSEVFRTPVAAFATVFMDDLEVTSGWVPGAPGDTATSGQWVRVDPIGTTAQPENDHTPTGSICWVTGQGAIGGPAGAADVDNGITTLTTPLLDGSDPDSIVRYWRWYSNNLGGNPNEDSMLVLFSLDGTTWLPLEQVSQSATEWVEASFRIGDFVQPPGSFRLRFVARDLAGGSLVEAAIDDLSIEATACVPIPADLNQDGVVDGVDLAIVLGAWGACDGCIADLDGNGSVDGADLALILGSWSGSP